MERTPDWGGAGGGGWRWQPPSPEKAPGCPFSTAVKAAPVREQG